MTPGYYDALVYFQTYPSTGHQWLPKERELHSLQLKLREWQHANFAEVSDLAMALGIVEEVGELAEAQARGLYPSFTDDARGDITIFAGQLLAANQMSIVPLLEQSNYPPALLVTNTARVPEEAVGMLAHAVLKRSQGIRGFDDEDKYRIALYTAVWEIFRLHGVHERHYVDTAEVVLKRDWKTSPEGEKS
jgi:hypothetical protein